MIRVLIPLLLMITLACGRGPRGDLRILIFHKQNGFIHDATPFAASALAARLQAAGFSVDATVDSLAFSPENLARYAAVVFLNTNYRGGRLLDDSQEAAFEAYIRGGGGFAGIHSAVPLDGDWEETVWPWYARLFGGRFAGHAPYREGDLVVDDPAHPSTASLPARLRFGDEWYDVRESPAAPIRVLATMEELPLPGDPAAARDRRPISWCQAFDGGRSWVTLAGHDETAFRNAGFLSHLAGGVAWAAGLESLSLPLAAGLGRGGRLPWRLRVVHGPGTALRLALTDGLDERSLAGRARRSPSP